MSADCPQYRVLYLLIDESTPQICEDGPYDYRSNAIEHRNWFFGHSPGVVACWVEKEGVPTGKRLER